MIIILIVQHASIVLLSVIFGIIDYKRTKANKNPIFAIPFIIHDDNGSKEYFGLGYKIIKCNTLVGDRSRHIGFYHITANKNCITKIEHNPLNIAENNLFGYEYKPSEKGAQHIYSINAVVNIKENSNFKSFGHKSINELENNLGIKLLKSEKIPTDYLWLMTTSSPSPYGGAFVIDYDKNDSPGIVIKMSNYEDGECEYTLPPGNGTDCYKTWPAKTLTVSIMFLTQYASERGINNYQIIFNDFSATEPNVEIYRIKSLGVDAYIDGYPLVENGGTGMFSIMFMYENMVYQFDGQGFTNLEIIEMIESMKY